jgi:hypothetical protein
VIYNSIRVLDVLDHYHVDPIKIAEWITNQRIKIIGIIDDTGKTRPKEVTASEVDNIKYKEAIHALTQDIRLILKSRSDLLRRVNAGGGASFELIDQIDEIEEIIRNSISYFVFEKSDFERLLLTEDEFTNLEQKKTNLYPEPDSVPSKYKKRFSNQIVPIKTEQNIKWADIKITFLSDDEILVQYGNESDHRKFFNAGFEDRRNGKPIGTWFVLNKFAESGGLIQFDSRNRRKVEKAVQIINTKLLQLFPNLQDNPIKINKKKNEYHSAFQIESQI